jgi:hypothetical protein
MILLFREVENITWLRPLDDCGRSYCNYMFSTIILGSLWHPTCLFDAGSKRKSTLFWEITPCSPFKVNRCFGGTYRRAVLATCFHAILRYVPPKRRLTYGGLHGVISEKITTTLRTSNATSKIKFKIFILSGLKFHNAFLTILCHISLNAHGNLNLTAFIFDMGSM